jgi:hypothetical protein
LFDMVELTDTRQGFQCHGTFIGLVQIENFLRACAQQPSSMQGSWRVSVNKAL